jgi:ubiquitin conjugation factor E4 B
VLESLRKDLEDDLEEGKGELRHTARKGVRTVADDYLVARLSVAVLDQLILSICGQKGVVPMDHLIGSWRRAMDIQRKTPASRLDATKIAVLKEARRMCVNYALYCITLPDMFGYVLHHRRRGCFADCE